MSHFDLSWPPRVYTMVFYVFICVMCVSTLLLLLLPTLMSVYHGFHCVLSKAISKLIAWLAYPPLHGLPLPHFPLIKSFLSEKGKTRSLERAIKSWKLETAANAHRNCKKKFLPVSQNTFPPILSKYWVLKTPSNSGTADTVNIVMLGVKKGF